MEAMEKAVTDPKIVLLSDWHHASTYKYSKVDGGSLFIKCPMVNNLRMFLSGPHEAKHTRESLICDPSNEIHLAACPSSVCDDTPSCKSSAPLSTTEEPEEYTAILRRH